MKHFKIYLFLLCVVLFNSVNAHAHQLSTSYLTLNTAQNDSLKLSGHWQVEVADIEQIINFDLNNDGNITWQEITFKQSAISEFVRNNIAINQNQRACIVGSIGSLKLDRHFNQPYIEIPLTVNCVSNGALGINYSAFFDKDSNHKSLISINNIALVYGASKQNQMVTVEEASAYATAVEYLYQGILHIWMGLDHILFLVALLLTCVLVREQKQWRAVNSKIQILKHTAWIVTAFTIAHSITLTLTAMEIMTPSSRWVEIGIALSVAFAALNNIWPVVVRLGWVTFGFGLLHGMGFAGVLGELGLSNQFQLLSVLTFNLGVEIGQLAILAAVLPLLIAVRDFSWYRKWILPTSSLAIALIAIQWTFERV